MREQKLFLRMLHNAISVAAFGYMLLVLGESASLKRIFAHSQREFANICPLASLCLSVFLSTSVSTSKYMWTV
jgi:hypothetical protein